jgi:hypothetical protein
MSVILVYHKSLFVRSAGCAVYSWESDSQRGLLIVRRSCGRNRSAQVGPEPDREGSHVGNRPSLACQTVRGSVRSFVLTGFQRALSTILVDDVSDFDEFPTRDSSGLSSVHRLTIGFNPRRPKARCAGLMLRRETAQMFSPSSKSRDLKPLKWMNGFGIENRS